MLDKILQGLRGIACVRARGLSPNASRADMQVPPGPLTAGTNMLAESRHAWNRENNREVVASTGARIKAVASVSAETVASVRTYPAAAVEELVASICMKRAVVSVRDVSVEAVVSAHTVPFERVQEGVVASTELEMEAVIAVDIAKAGVASTQVVKEVRENEQVLLRESRETDLKGTEKDPDGSEQGMDLGYWNIRMHVLEQDLVRYTAGKQESALTGLDYSYWNKDMSVSEEELSSFGKHPQKTDSADVKDRSSLKSGLHSRTDDDGAQGHRHHHGQHAAVRGSALVPIHPYQGHVLGGVTQKNDQGMWASTTSTKERKAADGNMDMGLGGDTHDVGSGETLGTLDNHPTLPFWDTGNKGAASPEDYKFPFLVVAAVKDVPGQSAGNGKMSDKNAETSDVTREQILKGDKLQSNNVDKVNTGEDVQGRKAECADASSGGAAMLEQNGKDKDQKQDQLKSGMGLSSSLTSDDSSRSDMLQHGSVEMVCTVSQGMSKPPMEYCNTISQGMWTDTFEGNAQEDIERFLKSFEIHCRFTQVPETELCSALWLHLKGYAQEVIMGMQDATKEDYLAMKKRLQQMFGKGDQMHEANAKIENLRYRPGARIMEFMGEVMMLLKKANPEESTQVLGRMAFNVIRAKLPKELRMEMTRSKVKTLEDLEKEAATLEELDRIAGNPVNTSMLREMQAVNVTYMDQECTNVGRIEANRMGGSQIRPSNSQLAMQDRYAEQLPRRSQSFRGRVPRSEMTCYFCGRIGHPMMDCWRNPDSRNYRPMFEEEGMMQQQQQVEYRPEQQHGDVQVRCFKCTGFGHFARDCPTQMPMAQGTQQGSADQGSDINELAQRLAQVLQFGGHQGGRTNPQAMQVMNQSQQQQAQQGQHRPSAHYPVASVQTVAQSGQGTQEAQKQATKVYTSQDIRNLEVEISRLQRLMVGKDNKNRSMDRVTTVTMHATEARQETVSVGKASNQGNGNNQAQENLKTCMVCNRQGHTQDRCWRNPQSKNYRPKWGPNRHSEEDYQGKEVGRSMKDSMNTEQKQATAQEQAVEQVHTSSDTSADQRQVVIPMTIDEHACIGLIDTGSSVTFGPMSVAKALELELHDTSRSIKSADGGITQVSKVAKVRMKIAGHEQEVDMYFKDGEFDTNDPYEMIIGMDAMQRFPPFAVDVGNRLLGIGSNVVSWKTRLGK